MNKPRFEDLVAGIHARAQELDWPEPPRGVETAVEIAAALRKAMLESGWTKEDLQEAFGKEATDD